MRNRSNNQHTINVERGDLHIHNNASNGVDGGSGGDGIKFITYVLLLVIFTNLLDRLISTLTNFAELILAFWTSEFVLISIVLLLLGVVLGFFVKESRQEEDDFF